MLLQQFLEQLFPLRGDLGLLEEDDQRLVTLLDFSDAFLVAAEQGFLAFLVDARNLPGQIGVSGGRELDLQLLGNVLKLTSEAGAVGEPQGLFGLHQLGELLVVLGHAVADGVDGLAQGDALGHPRQPA